MQPGLLPRSASQCARAGSSTYLGKHDLAMREFTTLPCGSSWIREFMTLPCVGSGLRSWGFFCDLNMLPHVPPTESPVLR